MSYEKFSADNAAMLLIDHQVGTMSWVHSISFDDMKMNALMLAQSARILKMPVVLTSSMEEYAQGPLLSELESILPAEFAARIKRFGIVNAMDDGNFAAAVKATGRKKLIIAGVTNDVCTVYPALSLVRDGFEVQVVADAGGSPTKMADDIALRRMERAGVTLTTTNQLIAELAGSWTTPEGEQLIQVLIPSLKA
ncbi:MULTISPECIES: isochorismatase family protein [Betaproteobacteria]|jgi:nicotinamidase-related amidase|uniref:Isochorismatase family protein n=1 Tax=Thauera sinica TaxID=2665146 RepID=A0ABW1AZ01_9RHOO|nr:isochorismatase family protein [Thauera sp. K11]ATE60621.1 isochorismatase [Thauera sp. K11]ATE62856.1 isochorismatase [Thauera sp. K11]TXH16141.1 MAG: isochorismatase family protein [Gammaproteobacteria bacterium]